MSDPKTTYCSWCFEKTIHYLFENNLLQRNVYKCSKCKNKTLICRYCQNMAKGGQWDDELCAEHDGTIAQFATLNKKLDDIKNYESIFEGRKWNLLKAAKIGTATFGAAVVIGPLAFLAAPAIGGAVGALLGLSGAAATNAGLATIGGGAIAAGGFGMAGGVAVVTATGAALGGTFGGVVANSYFGNIQGFEIEKVKNGHGPGVIFIDGFLRQDREDPIEWKENLKKLYPENPWYYTRWESKKLVQIGELFLSQGGSAAIKSGVKIWAKKATKAGTSKMNPIGWALSVLGIANNPWSIASVKAGQTGVLLADIIARTNKTYILAGHSLGARVMYYTLMALSTKKKKMVESAHFLGGAIGNNKKDWKICSNSVIHRINNYYTENDWTLATLYKAGSFFTNEPIGRNPIESDDGIIQNIDVSRHVSGHAKFKDNFYKFAKK